MTELNGEPLLTAEGNPCRTGKREASLAQTRVFGVLLILCAFVLAYFSMYKPIREAQRTGQLQYYLKGVLAPPSMLYLGVAMLIADFRDGQLRTVTPAGKVTFTRKGWIFLIGLCTVMGLTFLAWDLYLKSIGFSGAF